MQNWNKRGISLEIFSSDPCTCKSKAKFTKKNLRRSLIYQPLAYTLPTFCIFPAPSSSSLSPDGQQSSYTQASPLEPSFSPLPPPLENLPLLKLGPFGVTLFTEFSNFIVHDYFPFSFVSVC